MTIRSNSLAIRSLTKSELEAISGGSEDHSGTSETFSGSGSGTVSGPTSAAPHDGTFCAHSSGSRFLDAFPE